MREAAWPDNARAMELLRRISDGDEDAFRELWDRLGSRVFAFALRRLSARQDAEEVRNDTLVELFLRPGRFRGTSRFSTYVLGIANNKVNSMVRSRKVASTDPLDEDWDPPSNEPSPEQLLLHTEIKRAIVVCME